MRGLILGISVFCLATFVNGDPIEYELSDYCGSSINVYSSAILKVDEWWAQGECQVQVYSDFHDEGDDKLRVEVLSLSVPCGSNSVQLYDGDRDTGSSLSVPLCGYDTDDVQSMYISFSEDYVTILLHADYSDTTPSFRLLATATAVSYESDDFVCDNNYDVRSYLQCDGYNNCGDWSDEHSFQCDDDGIISWSLEASVIAGAGVLCIVVAIIVIALIVKGRRQRRQTRLLNSGFVPGPPAYGTIQGGINQGYVPAPPPYTAKNGAAPLPPPYYQAVTLPPPQANLQAASMPPPPPPTASQVTSPPQSATTTTTTTVEDVSTVVADVAP